MVVREQGFLLGRGWCRNKDFRFSSRDGAACQGLAESRCSASSGLETKGQVVEANTGLASAWL